MLGPPILAWVAWTILLRSGFGFELSQVVLHLPGSLTREKHRLRPLAGLYLRHWPDHPGSHHVFR